MSDDDWGDYVGSDDDYGYGDGDGDDGEVEYENMFYEAEDVKVSDPKSAIEQYNNLILIEESLEKKTWTSKCYIEVIKIKIRTNDMNDISTQINQLLLASSNLSKYDQNTTIDTIFECVKDIKNNKVKTDIYESLIDYLKEKQMDQLWLSTILKMAKIYMDSDRQDKLESTINEIKLSSIYHQLAQNFGDIKNINTLLDIASYEIQLCLNKPDFERLRAINTQLRKSKAAECGGSDPKVMAVVEEANGRICMLDFQWQAAEKSLRNSFEYYQETGNERGKSMLCLTAIANILNRSEISPFQQAHAKIFHDDPIVSKYRFMRVAFEQKDHQEF